MSSYLYHKAFSVLVCAFMLSVPLYVEAASFQNPLALGLTTKILEYFIISVIYVGTPAVVVFAVWTGFLFVVAQGNHEGISKAKQMALRVLIGAFLLFSLWAVYQIVGNTLAGLSVASLLVVLGFFVGYVLFVRS